MIEREARTVLARIVAREERAAVMLEIDRVTAHRTVAPWRPLPAPTGAALAPVHVRALRPLAARSVALRGICAVSVPVGCSPASLAATVSPRRS